MDRVKYFVYLKKNDKNLDAKQYFVSSNERKMLK